jgi:xanthine dehydrogenase accessory factor
MDNIYKVISELERENIRAAICIIVDFKGSTPRKTGAKMIVFSDGKIIGSVGGGSVEKQVIIDAQEVIRQNVPLKKTYFNSSDLPDNCTGTIEVYIEPAAGAQNLFIFGAGHIGKAISDFASNLDFNITIFDNREEIFKNYDLKKINPVCGEYSKTIETAHFDENTNIIIASAEHSSDEEILAKVGKKPHAYIGMIGSKRKVENIRKKFTENSILTSEQLNSVDMPAGVKINAQTPEEIAISVIAKLIDFKNNKLNY